MVFREAWRAWRTNGTATGMGCEIVGSGVPAWRSSPLSSHGSVGVQEYRTVGVWSSWGILWIHTVSCRDTFSVSKCFIF